MNRLFLFFFCFLWMTKWLDGAQVILGIDRFLTKEYESVLRGKRIGLITNHTAINSELKTTLELLKEHSRLIPFTIGAIFAPEHGLTGAQYAGELVSHAEKDGIPIYSLHGETRRPTKVMLQHLQLLVYDIQDIGSRSYTYISTLFYVMEEAAKYNIPVIVLDRPNPINGLTVDGPVLEDKWRSIVGYLNVPYCHGMTVGELAYYFNKEYQVNCQLSVVPMKGWKRAMTFADTGLKWIPTSPNIPEASTAFYYPTTGILGELHIVNIGIGYTLPFKVVGAPWIDAYVFAQRLNEQHFPGVYFYPYFYRPFYGKFAGKDCQGVLIVITNSNIYLPVTTQFLLIGILKSLYPKEFKQALKANEDKQEMFNKVNGTDEIYRILKDEQYVTWKLKHFHRQERINFIERRAPYLIADYK